MSGNAWEWCADWFDDNYYSKQVYKNPQGYSSGLCRILRGGSFFGPEICIHCFFRFMNLPNGSSGDFGFRCAR
jgi:sulfatase modifying factor 1